MRWASVRREYTLLIVLTIFILFFGSTSLSLVYGNSTLVTDDHFSNPELKQSYDVGEFTFNIYTGYQFSYDYSSNQLDLFITVRIETDDVIIIDTDNSTFIGNTINSTWAYLAGNQVDLDLVRIRTAQSTSDNQQQQIHQSTMAYSTNYDGRPYYDFNGKITTSTRLWTNDSRLEAEFSDYKDGFLVTEPLEFEFNLSGYDPILIHLMTLMFVLSLGASCFYFVRLNIENLDSTTMVLLNKFYPHVITTAIVGIFLPYDLLNSITVEGGVVNVSSQSLFSGFLIESVSEFILLLVIPFCIEQLFRNYHYYGISTGQMIEEPVILLDKYQIYTPNIQSPNTYTFEPSSVSRTTLDLDEKLLTIYSRDIAKFQLYWFIISVVGLTIFFLVDLVFPTNIMPLILLTYYIWVYLRKVILIPRNHPDLK